MDKNIFKTISCIVLFCMLIQYSSINAQIPDEQTDLQSIDKQIMADDSAPTGFILTQDTLSDMYPEHTTNRQSLPDDLYQPIAEIINPLTSDPNSQIRTRSVEEKNGYAYLLTRDNYLFIYDINDLSNKTSFTTYNSPTKTLNLINGNGLLRNGNYLYAFGYNGLTVLNIHNSGSPSIVRNRYDLSIYNLVKHNNFLIAPGRERIAVYSISDPSNPVLVSTYYAKDKRFFSAIVYGDLLYASDFVHIETAPYYTYGFSIINFSKPSSLSLIRYELADGAFYHMKLMGDKLISCSTREINLWSLSSPVFPKLLDSYQFDFYPMNARVCELDDNNFLITNGNIFSFYDNSIKPIALFAPGAGHGDGFPYGSIYTSDYIFLSQNTRILVLKRPSIFTVSGYVVDQYYLGIHGLTISSDVGISTTTGSNGHFSITLPSGSRTLFAQSNDYSFFPSNRLFKLQSNISNQNFYELICGSGRIPLYLQGFPSTPSTLPNRPYWYNQTYGNYPDGDTINTVGRWGCNMASAAMSISYFGLRYTPQFTTDPGILNSWLRDFEGYNENNGVIYSRIRDYSRENGVNAFVSIGGVDDERLQNHICSGNPAMLRVRNNYGDHFVLATGRINIRGEFTFTINDPALGETTLLDSYNDTYYGAYYFMLGPSVYDRSMIEISAHSPIHIVVTDPLGRQAGYDPRTDTYFSEIPNAGYDVYAIASPDGETQNETKLLLIPMPMSGQYRVNVIGYDAGSYEISMFNTDAYGVISQINYSGSASDGSVDEYPIIVDEKPEFQTTFLPLILLGP